MYQLDYICALLEQYDTFELLQKRMLLHSENNRAYSRFYMENSKLLYFMMIHMEEYNETST